MTPIAALAAGFVDLRHVVRVLWHEVYGGGRHRGRRVVVGRGGRPIWKEGERIVVTGSVSVGVPIVGVDGDVIVIVVILCTAHAIPVRASKSMDAKSLLGGGRGWGVVGWHAVEAIAFLRLR